MPPGATLPGSVRLGSELTIRAAYSRREMRCGEQPWGLRGHPRAGQLHTCRSSTVSPGDRTGPQLRAGFQIEAHL